MSQGASDRTSLGTAAESVVELLGAGLVRSVQHTANSALNGSTRLRENMLKRQQQLRRLSSRSAHCLGRLLISIVYFLVVGLHEQGKSGESALRLRRVAQ